MCLPWGNASREWIDVLVDIDGTLVHSGGPIKVPGYPATYSLAHGALEFLVALDRLSDIRLGLYSSGARVRNLSFAQNVLKKISASKGYKLRSKLFKDVYTVGAGIYGKKQLEKLRGGLELSRAILVDDQGTNMVGGEEMNLLKIYERKRFKGVEESSETYCLYMSRLNNNLVRALGMILVSIDMQQRGDHATLVEALSSLQWDGNGLYLHDKSNSREIYGRGLRAMRSVNPEFSLSLVGGVAPWESCEEGDGSELRMFPREKHVIIRDRNFEDDQEYL